MAALAAQLIALLADESGQDLVEYALVVVCIGIAAVAAVKLATNGITNVFSGVGSSLTSAT